MATKKRLIELIRKLDLPSECDGKEELGIVRYKDGTTVVKPLRTFDGEWAYSRVLETEVTHWMTLPEPPKEK